MGVDPSPDVSQRVMRAGKELFFAKGFANTSLRAIAAEAGTSESGVLRIYGSKSGLLRSVYASCWAEVNDCVEEALATARRKDPNPRTLILELMRTVWGIYRENPPMMIFILSHFGFRETFGLNGNEAVAPEIDERVRREYQRYLRYAHDLCAELAEADPTLGESGVTPAALGHMVVSMIYGIQTSWYVAQQKGDPSLPQVTMEEALAAAGSFLRSGALD